MQMQEMLLLGNAFLQDISYYQCYEVSGQQSDIIACLGEHFDMDAGIVVYVCCLTLRKEIPDHLFFFSSSGLTIKAKAYLKGQREGKAILYKAGAYPYGAIAPIHFLWQAPPPLSPPPSSPPPPPPSPPHSLPQKMENQEDYVKFDDLPPLDSLVLQYETKEHFIPAPKSSKLGIWCHPASKEEVLSELLKSIQSYNITLHHQDPMSRVRQEVSVTHRNLVRFRLLGPRSHAVLMETLKPKFKDGRHDLAYPLSDGSQSDDSLDSDGDENYEEENEWGNKDHMPDLPPAQKWWLEGELKAQLSSHAFLLAKEYPVIKEATDPTEFARGSVVGLCVADPRLFTPSKKTDMVSSYYPQKKIKQYMLSGVNGDEIVVDEPEQSVPIQSCGMSASGSGSSSSCTMPDCLPPELSFSPLWDKSVSDVVSKSLIPCHLLNRTRSKKLVRSAVLKLGDSAPCIPVLLIQQPMQDSSSSSHSPCSREYMGAGWDLILPPEWAMAFWISLIYRGARVCGMKELAKASLESQGLHFPQDFPDTVSGKVFYSEQRRELEARFSRKPPDKRLNYGKLIISTPFHFPWESLVRFWTKRDVLSCSERGVKRNPEHMLDVSLKKVKLEGGEAECKEAGSFDDFEVHAQLESTMPSENVCAKIKQSYYVLRSKEALNSLRQYISTVLAKKTQSAFKVSEDRHREVLQAALWKYAIDNIVQSHGKALVAVRIEISRCGNLAALDCLSLPTLSDLRSLLPHGVHGFSGPTEEMNQRGMTVVEKGTVTIGISSLTRKEIQEWKQKRKGELLVYCST